MRAREDAAALAALAAQARADAALAHAAAVARAERARQEAVAQAERAREDAAAQVKRAHENAMARVALLETLNALKLATALFERDVARGKVTARVLFEEAVADVWRTWERLDAGVRRLVSPTVASQPKTATQRLQQLLSFPGVAAYLQVAEEDNCLARGVLAKSAATTYAALCTPLHARAAGAQLPTEVFSAIGENGRIAFAALMAFGGRSVGLYQPCGATVPVLLRVSPALGISATVEQIRGSAMLPTVEASVELGVAGGE